MKEILVITKDKRIPENIKNSNYRVLSKDTFVTKANSTEGIEVEGGIFYNIDSLTQDIYNALKSNKNGTPITYYRFSDQEIKLPFVIDEDIVIYETKQTRNKSNKEKNIYEKQVEFISDTDNTLDAANFIINISNMKNKSLEDSFNSIEFVKLNNMEKIIAFSNALYLANDNLLLIMNFPTGDASPIIEPLLFTPPDELMA